MDAFQLAIAMAHNVVTELSAAMMSRELTPAERMLHDQSCRTLAGYMRLNEINIIDLADQRADECDSESLKMGG